jgi:hypothetical protein
LAAAAAKKGTRAACQGAAKQKQQTL